MENVWNFLLNPFFYAFDERYERGEARIVANESTVFQRRSFCFVPNRSATTTCDVVAGKCSPRRHLRNRRH